MEKVAIIGANRFAGFRLCDELLKEGIEVTGYVHEAHEKERILQAEMELFLGRSGNFTVKKIENTKPFFTLQDEFDAVYFMYFDQGDFQETSFFRPKMKEAYKRLMECISYCQRSNSRLIFLSSVRVFGESQEVIGKGTVPIPDHREGRLFLHFEKMLTKFSSEELSYTIIRVPTVYGPWQPLAASYQQACVQHAQKGFYPVKIEEDRRDVIFIDDVVQCLADCGNNAPLSTIIHLLSGSKGEWEKGADLLQISYEERESKESFRLNKEEMFVPSITIEEGIQQQKIHTAQLLRHCRFS